MLGVGRRGAPGAGRRRPGRGKRKRPDPPAAPTVPTLPPPDLPPRQRAPRAAGAALRPGACDAAAANPAPGAPGPRADAADGPGRGGPRRACTRTAGRPPGAGRPRRPCGASGIPGIDPRLRHRHGRPPSRRAGSPGARGDAAGAPGASRLDGAAGRCARSGARRPHPWPPRRSTPRPRARGARPRPGAVPCRVGRVGGLFAGTDIGFPPAGAPPNDAPGSPHPCPGGGSSHPTRGWDPAALLPPGADDAFSPGRAARRGARRTCPPCYAPRSFGLTNGSFVHEVPPRAPARTHEGDRMSEERRRRDQRQSSRGVAVASRGVRRRPAHLGGGGFPIRGGPPHRGVVGEAGRIPALRTPGGQHRFRAEEIRGLLEEHQGGGGAAGNA